MEGIGKLSDF